MNKKDCALVREALVREIRDASRWSAIIGAWEALLSVRRKEEKMEYFEKDDSDPTCSPPIDR